MPDSKVLPDSKVHAISIPSFNFYESLFHGGYRWKCSSTPNQMFSSNIHKQTCTHTHKMYNKISDSIFWHLTVDNCQAPPSLPSSAPHTGKLICVELHPTGLQTLYLASLQTEKNLKTATETLMVYWIENLTCLKWKGPGATPPLCVVDSRRARQPYLLLWRRKLSLTGRTGCQIGYQRNQWLGHKPSLNSGQQPSWGQGPVSLN